MRPRNGPGLPPNVINCASAPGDRLIIDAQNRLAGNVLATSAGDVISSINRPPVFCGNPDSFMELVVLYSSAPRSEPTNSDIVTENPFFGV